jgi:hypothetical protein
MTRTDAFAQDFCQRMLETEKADYKWIPGDHLDRKGHESIDVVGRSPRKSCKLILVEVELRKDAPLTNIVKVWRWIANENFKSRFVLIQAFSKYYKDRDTKRSNAEFIGNQMSKATGNRYLSISFDYNPYRHGKQGAGRRRYHARRLADKIRNKLRKSR